MYFGIWEYTRDKAPIMFMQLFILYLFGVLLFFPMFIVLTIKMIFGINILQLNPEIWKILTETNGK